MNPKDRPLGASSLANPPVFILIVDRTLGFVVVNESTLGDSDVSVESDGDLVLGVVNHVVLGVVPAHFNCEHQNGCRVLQGLLVKNSSLKLRMPLLDTMWELQGVQTGFEHIKLRQTYILANDELVPDLLKLAGNLGGFQKSDSCPEFRTHIS